MWILILLIYAGPLAHGDSVALSTPEFRTKAACMTAGEQAKSLTVGSTKIARYACVFKE